MPGCLDAWMADPADRAAILGGARALERVPELAGIHLADHRTPPDWVDDLGARFAALGVDP